MRSEVSGLDRLISQLLNGLSIGSIYALIALGYTMVYGIVKLINFAHGDIIMVGAYVALMLFTNSALPFPVVVVLTVILCVVLGVVIERIAYKPLRTSPRISSLITTIGVSFFLQNSIQLMFSPTPRPFPVRVSLPTLTFGSIRVSGLTILTILTSLIIMLLLQLFVRRTKMGKAMRAVSEDINAAQLMGININTTISLTFAIGAGFAAIGSVLYSTTYPVKSIRERQYQCQRQE